MRARGRGCACRAALVVERGRDALWILRPVMPLEAATLPVPGQAGTGGPVGVAAEIAPARPDRLDSLGGRGLVRRGPARPRPASGGRPAAASSCGRVGRASAWCPSAPRRPCGSRSFSPRRRAPARAGPLAGRRPGDEALWLVGVRRGAAAPITPATRRALRLRVAPSVPLAFLPATPYDTAPFPPGAPGGRVHPLAAGGAWRARVSRARHPLAPAGLARVRPIRPTPRRTRRRRRARGARLREDGARWGLRRGRGFRRPGRARGRPQRRRRRVPPRRPAPGHGRDRGPGAAQAPR